MEGPAMPFERWLHVITMRVRALFRGRALDADLDEELQCHVDHLIEANIERGMPPEAARRAALVAMGGVQQRKEECREIRGDAARSRSARRTSATRYAA